VTSREPAETAETAETADGYGAWAEREARGVSDCFLDWGLGVAADEELLTLIAGLPTAKRQPNLVFAAARSLGIAPARYAQVRERFIEAWPMIEAIARERSTQTNEAARCAVLLPLLAALPQPLSLIEVGASAGLCLYPDRYSYVYSGHDRIDPADGPSSVVLRCELRGPAPIPRRLPDVVHRAGVDLTPIDLDDKADVDWLETLIWPEHEDRRVRLRAAAEIVRADPPVLTAGDLNDHLPDLIAAAPADSTTVVFHTAVLGYLDPADRERFERTVRSSACVWISNESARVIPSLRATLPSEPAMPNGAFVLSGGGVPQAYAGAHGQWLQWFGQRPLD
jgi:hypothetical protein